MLCLVKSIVGLTASRVLVRKEGLGNIPDFQQASVYHVVQRAESLVRLLSPTGDLSLFDIGKRD